MKGHKFKNPLTREAVRWFNGWSEQYVVNNKKYWSFSRLRFIKYTLAYLTTFACYGDCRCDGMIMNDLECLVLSADDDDFVFRCLSCCAKEDVVDIFITEKLKSSRMLRFLAREKAYNVCECPDAGRSLNFAKCYPCCVREIKDEDPWEIDII